MWERAMWEDSWARLVLRRIPGDEKIAGCREIPNLIEEKQEILRDADVIADAEIHKGIRRTFSRELALLVDYNATVCQGTRAASAERRAHRHDRKRRSRERRNY